MQITKLDVLELDELLRRQSPRVELAFRYAIRTKFGAVANRPAFSARIDLLFAMLARNEGDYAAILTHAQEISEAMDHGKQVYKETL